MSSSRFYWITFVALCFLLPTFSFMFLLSLGIFGEVEPCASLLYQIVQPLYLLIILALRWLYETPLETVQEAERLRNGRWAPEIAADGSPRKPVPVGDINLTDHLVYTKAGTFIGVSLAQWIFWLWLVFPVKCHYMNIDHLANGLLDFFLTVPAALVCAIQIWQNRMSFLGPGYQFACEREIEDMEQDMDGITTVY